MSADGLTFKEIALDTYRERVVLIHRACPVFRAEGFQALARVQVHSTTRELAAVMIIADDTSLVTPEQIGLSRESLKQLEAVEGDPARVRPPAPLRSFGAVRRKIGGQSLDEADFQQIVQDIVGGQYGKTELSAFVVACGMNGLERDETVYLTRTMARVGRSIAWGRDLVVDKHCIGGIPGNRTSMIVVPIVAAHGLWMPKTSSRAITSPAGTADTMECLARVDLSIEDMQRVVRQRSACVCWGGAMDLSPADDIIISVERPLALDAEGQMVASILSKKLSAGSTHVLIDIPVGPTAKVRSRGRAQTLRKLFTYVAQRLGLHTDVLFTDGSQPVGRGVGPALEARDVLQVLRCEAEAPRALREKSLTLAGRVLEFDPEIDWGTGYERARILLESGRAHDAMEGIIDEQGRRPLPAPGPMVHDLKAPRTGVVTSIDNFAMARVARLAGAPLARGAGVDLFTRLHDEVTQGQPLLRIHAEERHDLEFAVEYLSAHPSTVEVA